MSNIYETRRLLDEYLLFHYGSATDVMPWDFGPTAALGFAQRSVTQLIDSSKQPRSALDLGCAVGRSSFELARLGCTEVLGIDYSHSFITAATQLAQGQRLSYERLEEAALRTPLQAAAPEACPVNGIQFEQGDAMQLRSNLGAYDLVHAANLLCRLTQPALLLQRLPALVKPGGQLLLTTPCTWLAEYTPAENWPQGRTLDWLQQSLAGQFRLVEQKDLPFLIRETARKFQWTVALGTRWERLG
jgi:putative 4-mercaptohistidine N1-methyltranferase